MAGSAALIELGVAQTPLRAKMFPPKPVAVVPPVTAEAAPVEAAGAAPRTPPGYGSLPAKGNPIGSGSEGTVFDLPGHPDWVLKEFKPETVATQASNEANNLEELGKVFGEDHVVKTVTPPRRFAPGEPVVLLKERVIVDTQPDFAARGVIQQTLREKGITADVGENLVWGHTSANSTPRWIWIE